MARIQKMVICPKCGEKKIIEDETEQKKGVSARFWSPILVFCVWVCVGGCVCVCVGGCGQWSAQDCKIARVRTDLENLEKYLNFENCFQGLEKALKIAKIKKILEKTLNFGVTSLTFVESKILASNRSREAVCRKSLAKSWDRSTSGEGEVAGIDAKAGGMRAGGGLE